MAAHRRSGKLAVILHADVAGSTALVQQDEHLAHERIQDTFRRFGDAIGKHHGRVRELRGDALLAEFERASDAVTAALAFQADHASYNAQLNDSIRPIVRVGIAMGEVVIADNTVTGAGVVLAQRVEQLAEPGGVCITGAIHEALPQRMPFVQEDLGEQQVKGFDERVRVYRVALRSGETIPPPQESRQREVSPKTRRLIVAVAAIALVVAGAAAYWFKPWAPREEPASVERMAFPLPDKSSIAVLPFTNMSNDAEQEYFVDGMTEDLITDLSKLSGLFVIARNSVFTYKDKAVKVRQVAEELGVRYVLEGSVRRSGDQVRINAQLIDATTGGHLWAERYDGALADVFALQDQVSRNVVAALSLKLTPQEEHSQAEAETSSPEAYDEFLRGWEHYKKRTPEHYAKALAYFVKAIELDPDYGRAHAAMASIYWDSAYHEWSVVLGLGLQGAKKLAKKSVESALQHPTALAHQVVSQILIREYEHDDAIAEARLSIAINPNDADGNYALAEVLIMAGKLHEVSELLETARRLDPHSQDLYSYLHGMAQFGLNRFEAAAASFERAIELNPDYWEPDPSIGWCKVCEMLAATYGHLGRMNNAKTMIEKVHKYYPQYSVNNALYWWPYKHIEDRERFTNGLRKAGLPDFVGVPADEPKS